MHGHAFSIRLTTSCLLPTGRPNRLHGVCGGGEPGTSRQTDRQTKVVLQGVRPGRERLPRQAGSETHHQSKIAGDENIYAQNVCVMYTR